MDEILEGDHDEDEPFDSPHILKAIRNVTNWFLLGIHLHMEQHDLRKIEVQYHYDIDRCKLEMISCWRRNDPTANWQKLRQALRSRNYDLTKSHKADDGQKVIHSLPGQKNQVDGKDFKRQVIKVENQPPFCGKHKELLQYFCNDPSCSQLLCYQCLGTGDHSKHEWMELNQAMISMKTRLEQAGHATKEAAIATQRQMDALCKEEDRLQSKCETAKASIHTNIGDIRSQLDDRKAHFESNLKHATQCHSFLKHKISRETLSTEEVVLHELQTNGKDILARLNSRDPMSLGETEKTRDRLKEAQDTVAQIKKQCSSPTSQFKANPNEVRTKLSNYGKIMVDTFEQGSHSQSSSIEPYEPVFRSKQRPQSAIDLQSLATSQRSCFSKVYSKIQRPPVPKKPFLRRQSADVIHAIRKSGYRVYPLEQSSLTVHNIPLLNRTMARGFEIEEKRLSNVCSSSQEEHEEIYDDPASPPLPPRTFSLPRAPPFPPPPPPSKDGTTVAIQSQFNDEELYEEVDAS